MMNEIGNFVPICDNAGDSEYCPLFSSLPLELFLTCCTNCVNYGFYQFDDRIANNYYQTKSYQINRFNRQDYIDSADQFTSTFTKSHYSYLTLIDWMHFDSAITNRRLRKLYLEMLRGKQVLSPVSFLSSHSLRWIMQRQLTVINIQLTSYLIKQLIAYPIDLSNLRLITLPTQSKDTLFDTYSLINRLKDKIHLIDLEKNQNVNISMIKKILKSCGSLGYLSLSTCKYINDLAMGKVALYGRNLKELNISKCHVTNAGLVSVADSLSSLKSLDISYCPVSYSGVKYALAKLPMLFELSINYLEFKYRNAVEEVSDLNTLFQAFRTHRGSLQLFSVNGCRKLSDVMLVSFLYSCRRLKKLSIAACVLLTDNTLYHIATSLKETLEALDVRECCELSDSGVIALIQNCSRLRDLALDGCYKLTNTVFDDFQTLRQVGESDSQITMNSRNIRLTSTQCPKITHRP